MSTSKHIQTILNGTIQSLKSVIPIPMEIKSPSLMVQPFEQKEMAVLIGIIGDVKGRIIIDSSAEFFSAIGATMFGMPLEGEMLESFTGELGNMVAGNLCTSVASEVVLKLILLLLLLLLVLLGYMDSNMLLNFL